MNHPRRHAIAAHDKRGKCGSTQKPFSTNSCRRFDGNNQNRQPFHSNSATTMGWCPRGSYVCLPGFRANERQPFFFQLENSAMSDKRAQWSTASTPRHECQSATRWASGDFGSNGLVMLQYPYPPSILNEPTAWQLFCYSCLLGGDKNDASKLLSLLFRHCQFNSEYNLYTFSFRSHFIFSCLLTRNRWAQRRRRARGETRRKLSA